MSGSPVFSTIYVRDKLRRITQKIERISGITDTYDYGYDTTGRLQRVTKTGAVLSTYTYDVNRNRLRLATLSGTVTSRLMRKIGLLSMARRPTATRPMESCRARR